MARGRAHLVKQPRRTFGFSHSFGTLGSTGSKMPEMERRELLREAPVSKSQSNGLDQDIAGHWRKR
jgi:hypothetical protein